MEGCSGDSEVKGKWGHGHDGHDGVTGERLV